MIKVKRKAKHGEDDLAVLHPDRTVAVGNEAWTVREFSLLEGAQYWQLGVQTVTALKEGTGVDLPSLVALLARATGKDLLRVAGLPEAEFKALTTVWLEAHEQVFVPDQSTLPNSGRPARWGDIYSELIQAGHDPARIGSYTARQIRLFHGRIQSARRARRADRIVDVNNAFAGGKAAKSVLKKLQADT